MKDFLRNISIIYYFLFIWYTQCKKYDVGKSWILFQFYGHYNNVDYNKIINWDNIYKIMKIFH